MIDFSLSFPVTYVVHIGAGFGAEAEAYLAAGLAPIVLVDADRHAVAALEDLARHTPAIRAVEAAVSARSGEQNFHRCNFSDLSALSVPEPALLEIFPGLEVLETAQVTTLSVVELLEGCDLPQNGQGLLVIEAPGEALGILAALAEAGWLARFPVLRLQEGQQVLHCGAAGITALTAELEKLGYSCWLEATPEDPDRPYLVAAWGAAVGLAQQKQDAAEMQGEADRKTIAELEQALSATESRLQDALDDADRVAKAAQEAAKGVDEAEKRVQDAEQNLAIALRMQDMREADLRELQVRYAELLKRQEGQDDLLQRMTLELSPMLEAPTAKQQIGVAAKPQRSAAKKAQKK